MLHASRLGALHTQVARIAYGINIPDLAVTRAGSGLRLAYVGRLVEEQKRISDVVRALARASAEVPETTAVIYGDGPDRMHVSRLLANEFPDRPVRLAGPVDSEKLQSMLLQVDVIVLLSDYEGLPIALLEAMACGCVPVCLRGRSGISELVVDGETGIVVNDRQTGFVRAIDKLYQDPALWSRLSRGAPWNLIPCPVSHVSPRRA